MTASPKAVCVPCRKVYKGNTERVLMSEADLSHRKRQWPLRWQGQSGAGMHTLPERCPECHGPVRHAWYGWRPPRRTDDRAWKRLARSDWWAGRRTPRPEPEPPPLSKRRREKALTRPTWWRP